MTQAAARIIGADGRPLINAGAYDAGDRFSRELRSWTPALRTPDADLLPEMGTIVARTKDLVRNYGLASGAVQMHLDNVIGAGLRLSAKPDYRALGLDADWAAEWSRVVESEFRQWAHDVDKLCDAGQRLSLAGMLGQGYRSYLTRGEITAVAEWLPERGGRYATAIQMVAADRVSNPNGLMNSNRLRAGVELDAHGAAMAYHVRGEQSGIGIYGPPAQSWRRVEARTSWGRRQFLHIYDQDEAGQTRGKSNFASVLSKMKMLDRFERTTLEAAVVNAMYAAVIESDLASATDAIGGGLSTGGVGDYVKAQSAFAEGADIQFDGVKIPHLFPGERLNFTSPEHPSGDFDPFEKSFLRQLAGGLNLSYEQLSRDYSQTNYSGARAGLLESWKFFQGRRQLIGGELATQIYCLWLEEAMDQAVIERPPGAPDFYTAKTAWTRCNWIGPGKSHIDPLKEGKADALENDRGWLTQEQACAQRGADWEENLHQIARERALMKELGLQPAEIGQILGGPAEPETP